MIGLLAARVRDSSVVGYVAIGVLGALVLSFGSAHLGATSLPLALGVCALPVLPFLLLRPDVCATLAMAALPFGTNIAGGSVGVNVGLADVLLAFTFLGLILRMADAAFRRRIATLRPLLVPVATYAAVAFVVDVPHTSRATVIALVQRFELVGVPLVIGAALFTAPLARRALLLFSVAAATIAATALLHHSVQAGFLGIQKNPAGQFVADALLLALVLIRRVPVRVVVMLYLALGMYFTYSRGAVLGALVGGAAYLLVEARTTAKLLGRLAAAAALVLLVYSLLPNGAQLRLLGNVSTTEYNDHIRRAYSADAKAIIREHPVIGVGIGNYLAGSAADLTITDDPHDVVLLEAAEGGYPLLVAFAVLQLGAIVVVFLRRRDNVWAAPAIAVQASVLTHAFVDVYWVRGTPVLGWLLVGLALGAVPARAVPDRRIRSARLEVTV